MSRTTQNCRRLRLEGMEDRTCMSVAVPGEVTAVLHNRVLTVHGSPNADQIDVTLAIQPGMGVGIKVAGTVYSHFAIDRIVILGEGGNDQIRVSQSIAKPTRIVGGAGDDTVLGGGAADHLYGGPGADVLSGGGGNDYLAGGSGDDTLDGGTGSDELWGQDGNDVLLGVDGESWDFLIGGRGDDTLIGDGDFAWGNAGRDRFQLNPGVSVAVSVSIPAPYTGSLIGHGGMWGGEQDFGKEDIWDAEPDIGTR